MILGFTPDKLRARGYSAVERGKYDIAEIVAAELVRAKGNNRKETIETEQALLLKARRARVEAQNAEQAGQRIHIDDVVGMMTDHITAAKKKLLTIGLSISQTIAAEDSPKRVAEIITAEVKSALEDLSFDIRKNFIDKNSRRLGQRVEAAADADVKPVGRKRPRPVT